jgi:hypothetical protein
MFRASSYGGKVWWTCHAVCSEFLVTRFLGWHRNHHDELKHQPGRLHKLSTTFSAGRSRPRSPAPPGKDLNKDCRDLVKADLDGLQHRGGSFQRPEQTSSMFRPPSSARTYFAIGKHADRPGQPAALHRRNAIGSQLSWVLSIRHGS